MFRQKSESATAAIPGIPYSGRTSSTILTPLSKFSHPRLIRCHAITARPTARGCLQDTGNRGTAIGPHDSRTDYKRECLNCCPCALKLPLREEFIFRVLDIYHSSHLTILHRCFAEPSNDLSRLDKNFRWCLAPFV